MTPKKLASLNAYVESCAPYFDASIRVEDWREVMELIRRYEEVIRRYEEVIEDAHAWAADRQPYDLPEYTRHDILIRALYAISDLRRSRRRVHES